MAAIADRRGNEPVNSLGEQKERTQSAGALMLGERVVGGYFIDEDLTIAPPQAAPAAAPVATAQPAPAALPSQPH